MALISRIATALAGRTVARHMGGMSAGPLGAVAGMALPTVMKRLGPWGMIGLAAGAWAVGRMKQKNEAAQATRPYATGKPVAMNVPSDGY